MGRLLEKPIFIIGCNRSGTTVLFRNLSAHPDTWSLYIESQDIFYRHHPIDDALGDRIIEAGSQDEAQDIEGYFYRQAHNKEFFCDTALLRHVPLKAMQRPLGHLYKRAPLRLVEKTPANSLRIPYLAKMFPDAKFIFLVRRGEDVVSSLMEGWKRWSQCEDKEWRYNRWHYLVPPEWQAWRDKRLEEICAFQYVESNRIAWQDLEACAAERTYSIRHEDLMADPVRGYEKILEFCELRPSDYLLDRVVGRNRVYTTGGSAPKKDKWKQLHNDEIESVRLSLEPIHQLFYPSPSTG